VGREGGGRCSSRLITVVDSLMGSNMVLGLLSYSTAILKWWYVLLNISTDEESRT
jgi:hypothetical protein